MNEVLHLRPLVPLPFSRNYSLWFGIEEPLDLDSTFLNQVPPSPSMEITFLGTSCMVPTKDRNVAGVFLKYKEEGILFDCGEGTQRQMNICGINRNDVTRICVSHWHGDHVSGIIGLIQTVGNSADEKVLHIYGPMGTKMRMEHLMLSRIFENKVDIRITELSPKGVERFFENEEIAIECAPMKHSVACNAYSFIVKDKFN